MKNILLFVFLIIFVILAIFLFYNFFYHVNGLHVSGPPDTIKIAFRAVNENNPSLCSQIIHNDTITMNIGATREELIHECYFHVKEMEAEKLAVMAANSHNPSLCENISSEGNTLEKRNLKVECYIEVADILKDTSICDNLIKFDTNRRNSCAKCVSSSHVGTNYTIGCTLIQEFREYFMK